MKQKRLRASIADLLIIVLIFTACGGNRGDGGGTGTVKPTAKVSFSPFFLPIEIAYDFLNNKISVTLSRKIQTPLGTFAFSGGVVAEEGRYLAAMKQYDSTRLLRIEAGDKLHIYKLEEGKQYSIKIPTDVYGESRVETFGTDGDITISIPHPTDETIAELRAKVEGLKAQLEEARAREEERARAEAERDDDDSGDTSASYAGAADASPSSSPEADARPARATEPRRGFSGTYTGSAGLIDIRESGGNEFSFAISTPRCSREAIGRARWTSAGLASSLSGVREDVARMGSATPTESACALSFTFSRGGVTVVEVGENCHCHYYAGLYSLE